MPMHQTPRGLAALREDLHRFANRRLLTAARLVTTVTMHLYRRGLVGPAGARAGLGVAGRLQRAGIRLLRRGRRRDRSR